MVVSLVHNQVMHNVGECALLKRCASNFEVLEEAVQYSMAGGEKFVSILHYNSYQFTLKLENFIIIMKCILLS